MKAIQMNGFGGTEVLYIDEFPEPAIDEYECLIRVHATALNRADLLQRRGAYPPPPGASPILGLEMAGEVIQIGAKVTKWKKGDRVCGLLSGGGYAELAAIHEDMAIPIPEKWTYELGTAIPEVFLTAYLNLFRLGQLKKHQRVLVHAGASGVGTAAIQLIGEAGASALVTAGSERKLQYCMQLGAVGGWNYHHGSFADWIAECTDGRGVDLILDFVGAPYFHDNVRSLAIGGKLIAIGMMGGGKVNSLSLNVFISRRLQLIGTVLRPLPLEDKIKLTQQFSEFALPRFMDGRLKPIIDRIFDWRDVAQAHETMESNTNIGKIVLRLSDTH